jgi:predicted MFS family arabinose efflux permease
VLGSSIALAFGLRSTFLGIGTLLVLTALFAAASLPRHLDGKLAAIAPQRAAAR